MVNSIRRIQRYFFIKSLGFRLAFWVALIAVLVIGVFTYINIKTQEREMVDQAILGAKQLSETLTKSLKFDMLHNYREAIYYSIETVGHQEGIKKVRIFNKEGKIMFSSDKDEIGKMVAKEAEACYVCHQAGQPLERLDTPKRTRIFQVDGERSLGIINPIYNEPECYNASCHYHPPGQKVLGVLDIVLSIENTHRKIEEAKRKFLFFGVVTIFAISTIIIGAIFRSVNRPVKELVKATRKIAEGDFNCEIPVRSYDEIGELALSFRKMTERLKKADEEIKELIRTLEEKVEERTKELKAAQLQIIQSEKLASIGKLSATIAHEINNPLNGILTYTKLIEKRLARDGLSQEEIQKIKGYLTTMIRETERCSSIVRNLLDFARQREPSLKFDVNLNNIVDDSLNFLSNQISLQNIEVVKEYSDIPLITADPQQMRQVLMNILMNACEAMPQGGRLKVRTGFLAEEEKVFIEVEDTGVGIEKELLDKIFDPFFTTKEKGTGLGLSVVYGIVNAHKGNLNVESKKGEGTKVTVKLPVRLEKEQKEQRAEA
ncbi:MAG: ATP-binding protein [Desulfobacterota bacterium]|nr:ATP-binding protein [Thermodesulfobacteriota bacterium]MDW8001315.1 ATP-binding protein [Deltaproteobacteria bacterium]